MNTDKEMLADLQVGAPHKKKMVASNPVIVIVMV
jgi:hypothetical protein